MLQQSQSIRLTVLVVDARQLQWFWWPPQRLQAEARQAAEHCLMVWLRGLRLGPADPFIQQSQCPPGAVGMLCSPYVPVEAWISKQVDLTAESSRLHSYRHSDSDSCRSCGQMITQHHHDQGLQGSRVSQTCTQCPETVGEISYQWPVTQSDLPPSRASNVVVPKRSVNSCQPRTGPSPMWPLQVKKEKTSGPCR